MEAIQKYGKYADNAFVWVNKNGETNGPLDFIHVPSNTGIQLKTIANANDWNSYKAKVKKGLDQLLLAIGNGDVTSGKLDIMMPEALNANFAQWKNQIVLDFGLDDPSSIYYELFIDIGSFLE